jgi:Type II site-specific deoxyribonuclease
MTRQESEQRVNLAAQLLKLSGSQLEWVQGVIDQFQLPSQYQRNGTSDIVTDEVLERVGDALRIHHAFSRQALSKDRFEFALERALKLSGIDAALAISRTNRGHDITIYSIPVSLKTEAANAIKRDSIHISKWMELGRGEWRLDLLLQLFLDHMQGYDRIFTMRRLQPGPEHYEYEFVEIPKALMLESANCQLVLQEGSKQSPKPGYGNIYDAEGSLKYALYFDGGSERKLQIKGLRKSLCVVHANWEFDSANIS